MCNFTVQALPLHTEALFFLQFVFNIVIVMDISGLLGTNKINIIIYLAHYFINYFIITN